MKIVKDTQFCVTNWSALDRRRWPNVVACAKRSGPTRWAWPSRITPLSVKCLIRGAETYDLPGRSVTVDRNSYLIVNEGTEYGSRIDSDTDVETASIFITSELCSAVLSSMKMSNGKLLDWFECSSAHSFNFDFVERLYPRDQSVMSILTNIHRLANSDGGELQLEEQMLLLTEHLLMVHQAVTKEIDSLKFTRASTRDEIYRRLHVCRDYMISNLSKAQSLDQISAVAGFAPHHFLRVFKEVFGTTPHQFLTALRLDNARDLVIRTDLPIAEVCAQVGFESISSFSALYKRQFSLSPLQHRRAKY